jgi:hypothetical protein
MTPEKFKGFSFMDLDFGEVVYGRIGPEGGPPHTLPRGIEHYLIVSNSSFPYYATLTSDTLKYIIAQKYWGRYNICDGYWVCGYNIYRSHTYLDRNGKVSSYQDCY